MLQACTIPATCCSCGGEHHHIGRPFLDDITVALVNEQLVPRGDDTPGADDLLQTIHER